MREIFLLQTHLFLGHFLAADEVLCSIPHLLLLGWLSLPAEPLLILFIFVKNYIYSAGGCHHFSVFTLAFCPLPLEFAHGKELNS